jgi:hypothetical protein
MRYTISAPSNEQHPTLQVAEPSGTSQRPAVLATVECLDYPVTTAAGSLDGRRAPLVAPTPRNFTLRLIAQENDLGRARIRGTTPACISTSKSISSTGSSVNLDQSNFGIRDPVSDTKPRFGRRRCSGI